MRNADKPLQNFGQIDPYFTVLAHPRFREAAKEGKMRREFFTSGEEHVERLLATVMEDLDPEFTHRRAPDLTLYDANKNCEEICEEADVRNVTPPKSEDSLENLSCDFDFLHCFIVFQHIPARRGANILRAMPRRLSENGAGPLHFNLRDLSPRLETLVTRTPRDLSLGQRPNQLVKGDSFRRPYIEMHSYNVNRLLLHPREREDHHGRLRFSDYGQYKGKVILFKKETLHLS